MKGSRRVSRELALQGLYQWLVGKSGAQEILEQMADKEEFARADRAFCEGLIRSVLDNAAELRERISPYLDRPIQQLSPIEHAILLMAASELSARPETPYRVIINEAVELAKIYGGTDGHKYVNGVLDKLAMDLRPLEADSRKRKA